MVFPSDQDRFAENSAWTTTRKCEGHHDAIAPAHFAVSLQDRGRTAHADRRSTLADRHLRRKSEYVSVVQTASEPIVPVDLIRPTHTRPIGRPETIARRAR